MLQGGFCSAVAETLVADGLIRDVALRCVGIPDEYVEQGKQDILRRLYGLDAEGIAEAAHSLLKNTEGVGGVRKLF